MYFKLTSILALVTVLVTCYQLVYLAYLQFDDLIDGQWTSLPGFNLLWHPHPDFWRTLEEIVKNEGMNVESHEVITEDGYIN